VCSVTVSVNSSVLLPPPLLGKGPRTMPLKKKSRKPVLTDSLSVVHSLTGNIRSPRSNDPFYEESEMSAHNSIESLYDENLGPANKASENEVNGETTLQNPITVSNVEQTTGGTTQQGGSKDAISREQTTNTPQTQQNQNARTGETQRAIGSRIATQSSQANASPKFLTKTTDKLTPIIIKRDYEGNIGQLCTRFKEVHGADTIQCKLVRGGTAVHLSRRLDYLNLLKYLKARKVPYRLLEEQTKSLSVVAKGIPHNTDVQEIIDDLKSKGIEPIKVTNVRAKNGYPYPIFAIDLPDTAESREIFKLTGISYYTVTIESRRSSAPIQCRNCQQLNHTTPECTAPPCCRLCAGEHPARECNITATQPRCCANCLGEHPADSINCNIRRAALRKATRQPPNPSTQRKWPIGQSNIRPGYNYSAALKRGSNNDLTTRPGPSSNLIEYNNSGTLGHNRAERGQSNAILANPNAQQNINPRARAATCAQDQELQDLRAQLIDQQVQLRAQQQTLIKQQNQLKAWQNKLIKQNNQLRQEKHRFNTERNRWFSSHSNSDDEYGERPYSPRNERPYSDGSERPYPDSNHENRKRKRKHRKRRKKPSREEIMQGTTDNEDILNRENDSVSTLSAQEPLTDSHEEGIQPGHKVPRERPSSCIWDYSTKYREVNDKPYLRNSPRDCIERVMNGLDDAWETIKNNPVEESLPVAFARLMGHLIGVYDRYYGY